MSISESLPDSQTHIFLLCGTGSSARDQVDKGTTLGLISQATDCCIHWVEGIGARRVLDGQPWRTRLLLSVYDSFNMVSRITGAGIDKKLHYVLNMIKRNVKSNEKLPHLITQMQKMDSDISLPEKIQGVYALDPVGSQGLWRSIRAFSLNKKAAPSYIPGGLDASCCPSNVLHARVILMEDERRPQYEPNMYLHPCQGIRTNSTNQHEHCEDVHQLWFPGVHSDAWGPSQCGRGVRDYLLDNLRGIGVHITINSADEQKWRDAPPSRKPHGVINSILLLGGRDRRNTDTLNTSR